MNVHYQCVSKLVLTLLAVLNAPVVMDMYLVAMSDLVMVSSYHSDTYAVIVTFCACIACILQISMNVQLLHVLTPALTLWAAIPVSVMLDTN